MSNSSVFKLHLKVLRSSADLQSYDSQIQTEGAMTLKATTLALSEVLKVTICRMIVMCMLVYSHGRDEIGKPECQQIVSCM